MNITSSPATLLILLITVVTSVRAWKDTRLFNQFILYPYQMARDKSWHRTITSGLIHADMWHLAFNMISLYSFATGYGGLEKTMGSLSFLVFYVATLIISDLTTVVRHKDNPAYRALGASGAVSAVILASVMNHPDGKLMMLMFPFPMPAWLFGILFIGYSHYASRNAKDNIGHEAHLWGAIAGVVLGWIMSSEIRENFLTFLHVKGIL